MKGETIGGAEVFALPTDFAPLGQNVLPIPLPWLEAALILDYIDKLKISPTADVAFSAK